MTTPTSGFYRDLCGLAAALRAHGLTVTTHDATFPTMQVATADADGVAQTFTVARSIHHDGYEIDEQVPGLGDAWPLRVDSPQQAVWFFTGETA